MFQIVLFGLFTIPAILFSVGLQKRPSRQALGPDLKQRNMPIVPSTDNALIIVRNIVRVTEYIGVHVGSFGVLDGPIVVFDAILIAIEIKFQP